MRLQLVAIVAVLLQAATAVHHAKSSHHEKLDHRAGHHAKHHAKKHHAKTHSAKAHHTATYAGMAHDLNKMVEKATLAEAEITESSRRLEEAILDVALEEGANATVPAAATAPANATAPALRGASKLPGNLSTTLSAQKLNLGNLFNHLKSNIANFNKREADQKKDSAAYADRLKKRLEEDKKKLANPNLSEFDHEMLVNRTRTEEHELKFWTTGRALQHDMFHSNLKLTHGLMSRVKTVMEAYKQMLATGKVDAKLTKSLHETSASLPKALIQKEERVKKDVKKLTKHLKISAKLLKKA